MRRKGKKTADDRVNYRDPLKSELERLQRALGHDSLSDTVREATTEYVAKRLPLLKRAA